LHGGDAEALPGGAQQVLADVAQRRGRVAQRGAELGQMSRSAGAGSPSAVPSWDSVRCTSASSSSVVILVPAMGG